MARRRIRDIPPPTAAEVRGLLDYNPDTGVFTRRVATGGRYGAAVGSVAGTLSDGGYLMISVRSKQYRAHRLAWLYMTGEWPANEIDHRNGVRTDNRFNNLRDVTTQVNQQNRRVATKRSSTGLLGASWSKREGAYVARIWINGRYRSLGHFLTAEAAHRAYLQAKRSHHEGCTI